MAQRQLMKEHVANEKKHIEKAGVLNANVKLNKRLIGFKLNRSTKAPRAFHK